MFSRGLIWALSLLAASSQLPAAGQLAGPLPAAGLHVENAWLRQLLPGQNKTAGYFDIINNGLEPVTLVGASSNAAAAIEIHRIIYDGDMVRMRRVEKVVVAPGETVRFRPGGLHLMLFQVSALAEYTKVQLLTDTGGRIGAVFRQVPLGVE